MEDMYTNFLTANQRKFAETMAKIEAEDRETCSHCGGEDCVCCEIYQDRQRWKSPEEMFAERW